MTRAKALEAVDEAFADGIKRLFAMLVTSLTTDEHHPDEALNRFTHGVAAHDDAHSRASSAVEKIFPE